MAVCGSIAPTATLAARPRAFRAAHPLRPSTRQRRLCSGAAAPLLHAWPAAESVAGAVAHALASTAATLSAVWAAVLRYVADVLVRRNLVAQQPAEELLVVNSSPGSPQTPEEYVNRYDTMLWLVRGSPWAAAFTPPAYELLCRWRTLVEKERSEAERLFKERVRRVPLKTLVKRVSRGWARIDVHGAQVEGQRHQELRWHGLWWGHAPLTKAIDPGARPEHNGGRIVGARTACLVPSPDGSMPVSSNAVTRV